ncbi:hypothetical protein WJN01_13845 [Flavobacteriaceae bacterium SZ-1-7]|uniref:hypothetical protein n=1 Tax=Tamlana sedimenti TaxID=3134126 RepID=UPI00312AACC7
MLSYLFVVFKKRLLLWLIDELTKTYMNSYQSLERKIDNAKPVDFSEIIDNVIELFKKVWLKGFLVILLVSVCAIVASILFSLIGLAPNSNVFMDGFSLEAYMQFYSSSALYSIPQNILIATLTLAFVSAFYKICKQFVSGETVVDDYFYFFKKQYFSKLLMLGIIHTAISTVAQLMFLVPIIYVFVPLAYFSIIFANNPELSEMEIVKASFKLGNKKWFISFGTMFVCGLMGALGILGCGIGILFTISIAYLPAFFIYKEVIGFDDTSEIDLIGRADDSDY